MTIKVKLGDIAEFQYWYTESASNIEIGPKFVRITDIVPDSIEWSTVPYCKISERDFPKYELSEGDIVVARTGATAWWAKLIRKWAPKSVFASYLIRIRANNSKEILSWFLGRIIESQRFKDFVEQCKGGSAQPQANAPVLREFEFSIPENIESQQRIIDILSAYDDLIENNTKRIRILESMAEELYKEWFVRFRFPGCESVAMVESGTEFWVIPEGWEVKPVWEVIETLWGWTPSTKEDSFWKNGNINWYSPVDLTTSGNIFSIQSQNKINELGLKKSSARLFPIYSVMLTSRATIGVVSINSTPACTNQGFITCIPNTEFSVYQIFFWLKTHKEMFINLSGWATFKEITKSTFRSIPVVISPKEITEYFNVIVSPIFKEIEWIEKSIGWLRETRDLLIKELF